MILLNILFQNSQLTNELESELGNEENMEAVSYFLSCVNSIYKLKFLKYNIA